MKAFETAIDSGLKLTASLVLQGARVWIARPAELSNRQIDLLERLLDVHELDRANRFHAEADRRAYVLAHGLRRLAVGQCLKISPDCLQFSKLANGRPVLATGGRATVFFSHSHSRDIVTCAVSHARSVGIDAELPGKDGFDLEWLAPHVALSSAQRSLAADSPEMAEQFLRYWTALEAFWKAAGTGFSPGNPRIVCNEKSASCFDVRTEAAPCPVAEFPLRAQVLRIPDPAGCVISLALMLPTSAAAGWQPSPPRPPRRQPAAVPSHPVFFNPLN